MKHVLLYWNHICVLHRQEQLFLNELKEKLSQEEIDLEVRYFGLGYPEHLSEYLAKDDAILPDLIVSADLEVFEDPDIYSKLERELYPARNWLPLKEGLLLEKVDRSEKLLPFVAIPLVYYTKDPNLAADCPLSEVEDLAFGGINNSAVKTVVKAVWQQKGKEQAKTLLETSKIADMPIGAYQMVRMNQAKTALVPSLYALRADGKTSFLKTPKEGPVLIPSYFCARKSVDETLARRLAQEILGETLCSFYGANGDLITYPQTKAQPSKQELNCHNAFCPDADFLKALDRDEFYDLYCTMLPTANNWKAKA